MEGKFEYAVDKSAAWGLKALDLVNGHRINLDLPLLTWSSTLHGLAYRHSTSMALESIEFASKNPQERKDSIDQIISRVSKSQEYVYRNSEESTSRSVDLAMASWLLDDDIRSTIEGDFTQFSTGIKVKEEFINVFEVSYENYFTLLFAKIR